MDLIWFKAIVFLLMKCTRIVSGATCTYSGPITSTRGNCYPNDYTLATPISNCEMMCSDGSTYVAYSYNSAVRRCILHPCSTSVSSSNYVYYYNKQCSVDTTTALITTTTASTSTTSTTASTTEPVTTTRSTTSTTTALTTTTQTTSTSATTAYFTTTTPAPTTSTTPTHSTSTATPVSTTSTTTAHTTTTTTPASTTSASITTTTASTASWPVSSTNITSQATTSSPMTITSSNGITSAFTGLSSVWIEQYFLRGLFTDQRKVFQMNNCSLVKCSALCTQSPTCTSFFHHRQFEECNGIEVEYSTITSPQAIQGVRYYIRG